MMKASRIPGVVVCLLLVTMIMVPSVAQAEKAKVMFWGTGGHPFHPRLTKEGLYFSDMDGKRVGLLQGNSSFTFWNIGTSINGLSVGDRVYFAEDNGDVGRAFALDPSTDTLYVWNYSSSHFIHVLACGLGVFYAGAYNGSGGIGYLDGDTLMFYDLNVTYVYDIYPAPCGIYFTYYKDNVSGHGASGIGKLCFRTGEYVRWRFTNPDLAEYNRSYYGTIFTLDGMVGLSDGTFYATVFKNDLADVVRFDPATGNMSIWDSLYNALHVKRIGNKILLSQYYMFDPGRVVVRNISWGRNYSTVMVKDNYTVMSIGGPETWHSDREARTIYPQWADMEKSYDKGLGGGVVYPIEGAHDFAGGYVAASGGIYLLKELHPEVHITYMNHTLHAWVTPESEYNAPVYVFINGNFARAGRNLTWNLTLLNGIYNLTAVYVDGEDWYTNFTVVNSSLIANITWLKYAEVKDGYIVYGMSDIHGAPVLVGGREIWTDDTGYFSFFTRELTDDILSQGENATRGSRYIPLVHSAGGNTATMPVISLAILAMGLLLAIVFYRKNRKGAYVIAIASLLLASILIFIPPGEERSPAASEGEENSIVETVNLTVEVLTPPIFSVADARVSTDGAENITDKYGYATLAVTPGVHNITVSGGNTTLHVTVAIAEDMKVRLPFLFDVGEMYLHNGPGYYGFNATIVYENGSAPLETWHPYSATRAIGTGNIACENCKLLAAMVGVVEGESCRLCCQASKDFIPAVLFHTAYAVVWDLIDFTCMLPWPPLPSDGSVASNSGLANYADDLHGAMQSTFESYFGLPSVPCSDLGSDLANATSNVLHGKAPGLPVNDPSKICEVFSCLENYGVETPGSCDCLVACIMGPVKALIAFLKCMVSYYA